MYHLLILIIIIIHTIPMYIQPSYPFPYKTCYTLSHDISFFFLSTLHHKSEGEKEKGKTRKQKKKRNTRNNPSSVFHYQMEKKNLNIQVLKYQSCQQRSITTHLLIMYSLAFCSLSTPLIPLFDDDNLLLVLFIFISSMHYIFFNQQRISLSS